MRVFKTNVKTLFLLSLLLAVVIGAGVFVTVAHAQVSIDFPTSFAGFSSQDLKVTIANIVRIILGFLGIIFLLIILAAGFIWMTSAGNQDKINRAKKMIVAAVIGLLIVLSAYAIASFIVQSLQQAVSPAPPGVGVCGDGIVQTPNAGGFNEQCDLQLGCNNVLCIWNVPPGAALCMANPPAGGEVVICAIAGGGFPGDSLQIWGHNFGPHTAGTSHVWFNDPTAIPADVAEAQIVTCGPGGIGWSPNHINAIVPATLPTANPTNYRIVVEADNPPDSRCDTGIATPAALPPDFDCKTTDIFDLVAPAIYCLDPNSGAYNDSIDIKGAFFGPGGNPGDDVELAGVTTSRFLATNRVTSWTDSLITFSIPDNNTAAPVGDLDAAISGNVVVKRGGFPDSGPKNLTVSCDSAIPGSCLSGCCPANACLAASAPACAASGPNNPVITNVLPNDGAPGNLITIQGRNFGMAAGSVKFVDNGGTIFNIVGPPFAACGAGWWSDTQIIIEVPKNPIAAVIGPTSIEVTNAVPLMSVPWTGFTVNATPRPGICSILPVQGPPLTTLFTLTGTQFTGGPPQDIFFGQPPPAGVYANPPKNFVIGPPGAPDTATGMVPSINTGKTTVSVIVGTEVSNPLDFKVEAAGAGNPIVNSVDPPDGPDGTYITINGSGFGTSPGAVWFKDGVNPPIPADILFPAQCGPNYWADDHIVVKSPTGLANGPYYLYVWNSSSNRYSQNAFIPNVNEFTDNFGLLRPGVCRINPIGGPVGTKVDYFGDNFGIIEGKVWFHNLAQSASPASWIDQQVIDAVVPNSAVTGMTTLESSANVLGNPLPFRVGACTDSAQCGFGNECCVSDGTCRPLNGCTGAPNNEENIWKFVTENDPFDLKDNPRCTTSIQSPTPYPYDQTGGYLPTSADTNAPVDVRIAAEFTRPIDFAAQIPPNVHVYECNTDPAGAGFNAAACVADITIDGVFGPIGSSGFDWQLTVDRNPVTPADIDFKYETWYEVRLDNGGGPSIIRAVDNSLYEGSTFLDPGNLGGTIPFRWHFRTRSAAQARCEIGSVVVTPPNTLAPIGGKSPYVTASPVGTNCYICGGTYAYDWECAPNPGPNEYARFNGSTDAGVDLTWCTPDDLPVATLHSNRIRFDGYNITPDRRVPPVAPNTYIRAAITNAPNGPFTSAANTNQLSVDNVPPRVSDYGPAQCTAVCTNAVPWVEFNLGVVDPPSLAAVKLYECSDPDCPIGDALVPVPLEPGYPQFVPAGPQGTIIELLPDNPLSNATGYRVIVSNSVRNTQSQTLDPATFNFDDPFNATVGNDSFSWNFKTSNVQCDPVTVRVLPPTATINTIGGTYQFSAVAEPATSCRGVRLNPYSYDWTWVSGTPAVADISHTPNPGPGGGESPKQTATAFQGGVTTIQATIPNPLVTTTLGSDLTVNDLRDPIKLIGHRPDDPPGSTPPEPVPVPGGLCQLGGDPSDCVLQCTNVLASAIFSTSIMSSSVIAPAVAPTDYSAYYSFKDGNPTEATDAYTPANNGALLNGALPSPANASIPSLGKGVELDGVDDIVRIPNKPGVNDGSTGSITVTAWIYPTTPNWAANPGQRIITKSWFDVFNPCPIFCQNYASFHLQLNNVGTLTGLAMTAAADECRTISTAIIKPYAWTHVALTYNEQDLITYINGVEDGNSRFDILNCGAGGPININTVDIGIGAGAKPAAAAGPPTQNEFVGIIDDVRIYPRALSAFEINTIRTTSLGQSIPSRNFYVTDASTGALVPGSISIRNYTDDVGVCTIDTSKDCTANPATDCDDPLFPGDTCNFQRGRIDFTPAITVSPLATTANPVSNWTFDNGTAADTVGANHGTIHGSVNTSSANAAYTNLGRAMSFDGNVGSYIDTGSDVSLNITGDVSLSAWINPADLTDPSGFGGNSVARWGREAPFGLRIRDTGQIEFVLHSGGGWVNPTSPTAPVQANGEWQHLAVTRSGTTYSFYYNGKLVGTPQIVAAAPTSALTIPGNAFEIGSASDGTIQRFNGLIDDVRVYNRALSTGEIGSIYSSAQGIAAVPGAYNPLADYQVHICDAGSCMANPILSAQGVPYTAPQNFGFRTGLNICAISFVDIVPNPAKFTDRLSECSVASTPLCASPAPKVLTANAKDASGLDLSGITYTWRETPPYVTNYYDLVQNGSNADATHKGVLGTDVNEVTTEGMIGDTATAQGKMVFDFCVNPWYGQGASPFYSDPAYDFKIRYCRDSTGSNPSDPSSMLPSLPAPHIERSPAGVVVGDLLKEHVFIVNSNATGVGTIGNNPPLYTTATPVPGILAKYRLGQLVSVKLDAKDPDGDSFLYTMQGEAGADALPASVSFNQKTGSFIWVIDKMPTTDSPLDVDTINDFEITFGLNPLGDTRTIVINVESGTPPAAVSRPTVNFDGPVGPPPPMQTVTEGGTITLDYGTTQSFTAKLDPFAAGAGYGGNGALSIKSFVWDFQDSGLSTYTDVIAPTYAADHVFLQAGTHQVTFRVQNDLGVWSDPTVVNVNVRLKTTLRIPPQGPGHESFAMRFKQLLLSALIGGRVNAQTLLSAPSQLTAVSVNPVTCSADPNNDCSTPTFIAACTAALGTCNQNPSVTLKWQNNGVYTGINIYRDGVALAAGTGLPPSTTTYTDSPVVVGTSYVYRVCGASGLQEQCSDVTVVSRNIDYDVIVSRVYKNLNALTVDEWYKTFAPNPTGNPKHVEIDGYDAIVDGTSVYIGAANCTHPDDCDSTNPGEGIYTNVLLFSYNLGAKQSTVDIFNQLIDQLRVNDTLTTRDDGVVADRCSQDNTIICDPGHDAVCAVRNAGLCQSAKAELRRDFKRIVDLHTILYSLDAYALQNHFCDDGTNSKACNTDADCTVSAFGATGSRCVGVYPSLTSGSYIAGVSTSQWPSWDATLGKALAQTPMPTDPVNAFGANFYSPTPLSCLAFPGYDKNTCWNERTSKFQCHTGSEVYLYKNIRGNNFNLYGLADATGWKWLNQDSRITLNDATYGGLCTTIAPVSAICGNGLIEIDRSKPIKIRLTNVVVNRNTATTPVTISTITTGDGVAYNPGDWIELYNGTNFIVDPGIRQTNGLNIQRLAGPRGPRVRFYVLDSTETPNVKDYEATIEIMNGSTRTIISDAATFKSCNLERAILCAADADCPAGTGTCDASATGLEIPASSVGICDVPGKDKAVPRSGGTSVDFCMQTGKPDNFYLDIAFPEVCDGGSTNYCDAMLGSGNWNNEFKVGCKSDCSGWGDPYAGIPGGAQTACGGSCGNGTVDTAEQCDSDEVLDSAGVQVPIGTIYSCTTGGSVYCSNSCQVACTAGRPYGGACGDGVVTLPEVCDEGLEVCSTDPTFICSVPADVAGCNALGGVCSVGGLNGKPGHCTTTCTGYGSYCGDGALTPLDEYSLGCINDAFVSCNAGYTPVAGQSCIGSGAGTYHQWSCAANVEECDNVVGLTAYSCPLNAALYCDTKCNRACATIDIDPATGNRLNVPVYEHYFNQNDVEDYDYSILKKAEYPYDTKGIAFYAYNWNKPGTFLVQHWRQKKPFPAFPLLQDYALDQFDIDGGGNDYVNQNFFVTNFYAYFAGPAYNNPVLTPVYEFRNKNLPLAATDKDVDHYYSRNSVPRTDSKGNTYFHTQPKRCLNTITQQVSNTACSTDADCGGATPTCQIRPKFFALLGPFQESCGNDVIEGNETCEPDTYQVPTASQSTVNIQYQCGKPFTANACRTYGGYCGDTTKNTPYEQCDEGHLTCSGSGAVCSSNADCPAGQTCDGLCAVTAALCQSDNNCARATCNTATEKCNLNPGVSCRKDSDCPQNTCNGNGAACNNNGGNCTYCSKSCSQSLVPRNYCGDGIINCGINTPNDCTDQDPYTEVCDDGVVNNGKAGQCNITCSGKTGAVCGNAIRELLCNNAPTNDCSTALLEAQCQAGNGVCGGEVCDDGTSNGRWSYQCPLLGNCSVTVGQPCTLDNDCPVGEICVNGTDCTLDTDGDQICDLKDDTIDNNSIKCSIKAKAYCGYSCLGKTPASCGDSIVQQPNDGSDHIPNTSDDGCSNDNSNDCSTVALQIDCQDGADDDVATISDNGVCLGVEVCDHGIKNGTAGFCNATCDGITSAICGDSVVGSGTCSTSKDIFGASQLCQTSSNCTNAGDTCNGGETCDPPASQKTQSCTDVNGLPGLNLAQCSNQCQSLNSQCQAYGLKIWSDGVDAAYLNGSLMILKPIGAPQCFADPDPHGADYSLPASPPSPGLGLSGNQCGSPSTDVPNQLWSIASDVRPIDYLGKSAAFTFEHNGPNTVAVKIWAQPAASNRSFLAVYTSPTARRIIPTLSGQLSEWACSNVYTPGWEYISCPDTYGKCSNSASYCNPYDPAAAVCTGTCGPDGFSDCDPTQSVNTWRRPSSYSNSTNSVDALCKTNYPNYVGATSTAQWIWGPRCGGTCVAGGNKGKPCSSSGPPDCPGGFGVPVVCDLSGAKSVVYCRLAYTSTGAPVQVAWNPNYGWINFSTAGSRVTLPAVGLWPRSLKGAAWNKNLGWLIFDGTASADPAKPNPNLGNPVKIDSNGNFIGEAWGINYGRVYFNPKNFCTNGTSACSDTGVLCGGANPPCNAGATCDAVNCTLGFSSSYTNAKRDPAKQILSGYAWSEKAGWIDLGAYKQSALYIPEL